MKIQNVPFTVTAWDKIETVEHKGESGTSFWQTVETGNIRTRIVEYSAGFIADHYCTRGHVLFVLDGDLQIKLKDGKTFSLNRGMSFQVEDDDRNPHTVSSETGAKVFIVD